MTESAVSNPNRVCQLFFNRDRKLADISTALAGDLVITIPGYEKVTVKVVPGEEKFEGLVALEYSSGNLKMDWVKILTAPKDADGRMIEFYWPVVKLARVSELLTRSNDSTIRSFFKPWATKFPFDVKVVYERPSKLAAPEVAKIKIVNPMFMDIEYSYSKVVRDGSMRMTKGRGDDAETIVGDPHRFMWQQVMMVRELTSPAFIIIDYGTFVSTNFDLEEISINTLCRCIGFLSFFYTDPKYKDLAELCLRGRQPPTEKTAGFIVAACDVPISALRDFVSGTRLYFTGLGLTVAIVSGWVSERIDLEVGRESIDIGFTSPWSKKVVPDPGAQLGRVSHHYYTHCFTELLPKASCSSGFDWDKNKPIWESRQDLLYAELAKRFCRPVNLRELQFAWPVYHDDFVDIVLALEPLNLLVYIVLEIIDTLPMLFRALAEVHKVRTIEKLHRTCAKMREKRKLKLT
jgi:hypothetical protein